MKCIVVIPIYKPILDFHEEASFRQCLKVLRHHPICIITYSEMNLSEYEKIAAEVGIVLKRENFNQSFFISVTRYNRLCATVDLYRRFDNYEYMLLYQLDAWVFRDELIYWCNKGYDYIGAPWFKKDLSGRLTCRLHSSGNGGFSLRKISFCIRALSNMSRWPLLTPKGVVKMTHGLFVEYLKIPFKIIGIRNNMKAFLKGPDNRLPHEDALFAFQKYAYQKSYQPKATEAIAFSFEAYPSYLYRLNGNKLPFGCHAFTKFEYDEFWKKYIQE